MRYPANPELPISLKVADQDGNDHGHSDHIASIAVSLDNSINRNGRFQFEIRGYPKKDDILVIEASLPEVTAAITSATLHREDNRD